MTDANERDANETKQNNAYIDKIIDAIGKTNKSEIINNNSFEIESSSSPYFQFLKQTQIPNKIAIIVGHSQQIKQMHKELLINKPNEQSEPNEPNVYLFRHGHSCNNAKSKTKITDAMAAATLKKDWDPSLTTYGILTTLHIGMRNANLLNQSTHLPNTLIIYVSQLIRTWETAFLLWIGMLLVINHDIHTSPSTHTLKLHINELLNEHKFSVLGKEFDRGNAAENRQHQVILFKQFIKYILNNIIAENIVSVSVYHTIGYELKNNKSGQEEDSINIEIKFEKKLLIKSESLLLQQQTSDTNADPISTSISTSTSSLNSTSFEQINKHNTYCIAFHLKKKEYNNNINIVLSSFKYHSGFEKFPNSLSNCEPLCYYDRGDLKKGKYTRKKYNSNKCQYDLDSFNDKKDTMNKKETRVHHFTRKIGTSIKNAIDNIRPTKKISN